MWGGGNMVAPKRPGSFLERSLAADKFRPRDTSNDWRERLEHCSTTIEGLVIVLQRKWRDSWLHSNALDAMKDPERKPLGQSCALHFVSNKIEKKRTHKLFLFFALGPETVGDPLIGSLDSQSSSAPPPRRRIFSAPIGSSPFRERLLLKMAPQVGVENSSISPDVEPREGGERHSYPFIGCFLIMTSL